MARFIRFACVALFALVSARALADIKSAGEIIGTVQSDDKSVLPGASVTLTGAGLIQKSIIQVSDATGQFRFVNLNPGDYSVAVSMQGFATQEIAVTVSVGKTANVPVTLVLAGTSERVTIKGEAPLIDTSSPGISTTFDSRTLGRIPVGQSRQFLELLDATPDINDRGAAYGTGNGFNPEQSDDKYEKGSPASSYQLNGVDVSNVHYGMTWVNPDYETIGEVQVLGPGASAEYGSFTGAVVNIVTKSGTRNFHGSLSSFYSNSSLRSDNSDGIEDLKLGNTKFDSANTVTLGGPLVPEKLHFFVSGSYHTSSSTPPQASVYDKQRETSYQARLDFLASPSQSFSAMWNANPIDDDNLGLQPGSGPEIGYHYDFRTDAGFASWQGVWSDKTFSEVKYAGFYGHNFKDANEPNTPSVYDYGTGKIYYSLGFERRFRNRRNQGTANLTHYADAFLGASHEIKAGVEYEGAFTEDFAGVTGNKFVYIIPEDTGTYVGGFTYDGGITRGRVKRFGSFLQDNVKIGRRLTVNLGVRYDGPKLTDDSTGNTDLNYHEFVPRVGATYALTDDGRATVHFTYGRYYDKVLDYGPTFLNGVGVAPAFYYAYNSPTPVSPTDPNIFNLLFQPENYSYTYHGSPTPIDPNIKNSHSDVVTAGFEKQFGDNFVLGLSFIHKKDGDFLGIVDRATHTYEPFQYANPLGGTLTLYNRTDTTPNDYILTNSDYYDQQHNILILQARTRPTERLSVSTSLTWERNTGTAENGFQSQAGFQDFTCPKDPNCNAVNQVGVLSYDRTWQFKLLGSYQFPWQTYLAIDYRLISGRAWTPSIYSASVPLTDPTFYGGFGVLLEDRGSRRWKASNILNMRLAKTFTVGNVFGQTGAVEIGVDALNLFNNDAPVDLNTSVGSTYFLSGTDSFGRPSAVEKPRQFRFGARFSF